MVDWDVIATKMKERTLTLTEQAKIVKELRQEEAAVKEATREQGFLREAGKAEAAGNMTAAEEALEKAYTFALQEARLDPEQLNEIKGLAQEVLFFEEYEAGHGEIREEELSKLAEQISKELNEILLRIDQLQKLKLYYEQCALSLNKQVTANPALKQQVAAEVGKYITLSEETNDKIIGFEKRCRYLEAQLGTIEKRRKQLETEALELEEELAVKAQATREGVKFLGEMIREHPGLATKKAESQLMEADQEMKTAMEEAQKNPAQAEKAVEAVKENAEKIAIETKGTPVAQAAKKVISEAERMELTLAEIRKLL
jgi:hypothetical protein